MGELLLKEENMQLEYERIKLQSAIEEFNNKARRIGAEPISIPVVGMPFPYRSNARKYLDSLGWELVDDDTYTLNGIAVHVEKSVGSIIGSFDAYTIEKC